MSWMGDNKPKDYYTADQMHAYAQAHAAQRCAALETKLAAAEKRVDELGQAVELIAHHTAKVCRELNKQEHQ